MRSSGKQSYREAQASKSYRIVHIRAKGVWLVTDQNGMHLRTAHSLKHAERIIAQLKQSNHKPKNRRPSSG